MQTSIYGLGQSNSVVRHVLRQPLFRIWAVTAIVMLPWFVLHGVVVLCCAAVAWSIVFAAMRRTLIRRALVACFDACIEIQAKEIRAFQPEIVVGSSWGGGIAVMCAARGLFSCPQLLLAPSLQLMVEHLEEGDGPWLNVWDENVSAETTRRSLIVHGDQDDMVPLDHSRRLADRTGIPLEVVSGGDHSLNAALVDSPAGPGRNDRLRELVTRVASFEAEGRKLPESRRDSPT
jgi:hypothetical protein